MSWSLGQNWARLILISLLCKYVIMLCSFGKGEQPFRSYIIMTSLYFYCFSTSTQSEALESDSGAVSQWVLTPPTAFLSSRKSRSQWEGAAAGVHQSSGVEQPELHAHWPHPTVGLLLLHTAVSSVSTTPSLSSTPEVIVTALLFRFYHGSSLWCYLTSSKRRQWILEMYFFKLDFKTCMIAMLCIYHL